MGHLVKEDYGSVLQKVGERYYRFSDSVFKTYAAFRPFQFSESQQEE